MSTRCMFCNADAVGFCDALIALVDGGEYKPSRGAPFRVTTVEAMIETPHTCDAPFCNKHRKVVGFVCGSDPDTIDHCAGCVESQRDKRRIGLLTAGAIAAMRRQWHAEYRRRRIA